MSHVLYEHLEKADLLRRGKVRRSTFATMSRNQLITLAEESAELTSGWDVEPEDSIFSYTASHTLAGGAWPCGSIGCRLENVAKLSQFAAFYADRVYVSNPLAQLIDPHFKGEIADVDSLRVRVQNDLTILTSIRALVSAGRIIPVAIPRFCPHCLTEVALAGC